MPKKEDYTGERAGLSPAEKAKQDRRIMRAIQQGMSIERMKKLYGFTPGRVKEVATAHGLEIAKKDKSGLVW